MLMKRQLTPIEELEVKAKKTLPSPSYDFIAGGALREHGLSNNTQAFHSYSIIPRVLKDVGRIDTQLKFFEKNFETPIFMAPCAFHKLAHPKGEIATAQAAEKIRTIMTLSTMASYPIEEVANAAKGSKWFQLYFFKKRIITENLIRRAEQSGYDALVVTVDVPAMGRRPRDDRNEFSLPPHIDAANFRDFDLSLFPNSNEGSKVKSYTDQQFDSGITWSSIDWLASKTKLPIILKGILSVEDALESLNHRVSALIVSNHGGRQLDSAVSPLEVLPDIVEALPKKIPIIVDGGIKSGEDVFKALALGATAVMIGRPIFWSLAVGGEDSLVSTFDILKKELILTMRLSGCPSLEEIHNYGLSLLSSQSLTSRKILKKLQTLSTKPEDIFSHKKSTLFSKL